ncbi:hypothetical protein TWF696_007565 [Orbilia brochopaga]|uniref:Cryptochrome DASH n=1 Tax=Orbilia brochopaga TaxID=3140254 RepID=A0AAV9URQ3_9PEZI
MASDTTERILIYLVRRELRITDNPILHHISELLAKDQAPFTHLLPVYVFPARQVETCGFLNPATATASPYPPARSVVAGFPRCGPHRAKFWAESVWEFKKNLEILGSGLVIRVGRIDEILEHILDDFQQGRGDGVAGDGHQVKREVIGVWFTDEEGVAEKTDERNVFRVAGLKKVPVRKWKDEKYLVDDRDLPYMTPKDVPDSFAEFRMTAGSLRTASRKPLPRPARLPPLPKHIPAQPVPFEVPDTLADWIAGLLKPLRDASVATDIATRSPTSVPEHTYIGGEAYALERLEHLISHGSISTTYAGDNRSTSLAAWLALGCITARQINEYLLDFEDGGTTLGQHVDGYSAGENERTAGIRTELLWRDYLRLCTRKHGYKLFRLEGFKSDTERVWKYGDEPETKRQIQRFIEGRTGVPDVDAALREMYLTGYTSESQRYRAAIYFGRQLGIDWRIGAEWFEYCLIDYDVSGNWGSWQYCAGVANDPTWEFNPLRRGGYVATWVDSADERAPQSNVREVQLSR